MGPPAVHQVLRISTGETPSSTGCYDGHTFRSVGGPPAQKHRRAACATTTRRADEIAKRLLGQRDLEVFGQRGVEIEDVLEVFAVVVRCLAHLADAD